MQRDEPGMAETGERQVTPDVAARQAWIGLLANAEPAALEAALAALGDTPSWRVLRGPETGMVMLRARAGGTGHPFNMGEATLTRCSVECAQGRVGHGYVLGRAPRHAELAALFDGLFQDPKAGAGLRDAVLPGLRDAAAARRAETAAETAATKVEFFTLVRGEDE